MAEKARNVEDIYSKLFDLKQKAIKLEKNTEAFNYKYATLWQIQEKLAPILKELNLLILHKVENQKVVTIVKSLIDWSYEKSEIEIWEVNTKTTKDLFEKASKSKEYEAKKIWESYEENTLDPQWVGSIITYYRRYNLVALLDLETEDDDWAIWSSKAKTKQYTTSVKEKEKHCCLKCWEEVEVTTIDWQFGEYFKCPSCNANSWANKVVEKIENKEMTKEIFDKLKDWLIEKLWEWKTNEQLVTSLKAVYKLSEEIEKEILELKQSK